MIAAQMPMLAAVGVMAMMNEQKAISVTDTVNDLADAHVWLAYALGRAGRLDEAIAAANRLSFGLAGYAFTRSLKHAHLLAHELQVGMLYINQPATPSAEMPFGGVKDSGYGTEGGPEALDAYLNTRAVTVMNV